jgi:hypothetical protein
MAEVSAITETPLQIVGPAEAVQAIFELAGMHFQTELLLLEQVQAAFTSQVTVPTFQELVAEQVVELVIHLLTQALGVEQAAIRTLEVPEV